MRAESRLSLIHPSVKWGEKIYFQRGKKPGELETVKEGLSTEAEPGLNQQR